MQNIELSGAVGDVIVLSYQGDSLTVKLGEHGFVPDITEATIRAMKKDANAFLYAAQLVYRGAYSGEYYAKAKIAEVVKTMFDAIKPESAYYESAKPAAKTEKKATKAEKVEDQPAETVETPKAEEPKSEANEPKAETPETKSDSTATETETKKAATTAKKSSTTTKKTATTATTKRKSA